MHIILFTTVNVFSPSHAYLYLTFSGSLHKFLCESSNVESLVQFRRHLESITFF